MPGRVCRDRGSWASCAARLCPVSSVAWKAADFLRGLRSIADRTDDRRFVAMVLGTALCVLYLTGVRRGELLRLTQADVDLDAGVLRIHHTKFGKSRLVPVAPDVVGRLRSCQHAVRDRLRICHPETPFFATLHRTAILGDGASQKRFTRRFRSRASRACSGGRPLRLHDLRHSWAVLRLTLWCEQDVDLGAKLPLLATYLGHVGLASSQRYLQLTQDLVVEVTRRHQARFGHLITDGQS